MGGLLWNYLNLRLMKETEKGICFGALKKFIRKLERQIKIQKKELDLYKKKVVEFKRKSKYYDRAIGKGAVVFSDVPEVLGCGMSPELLMEILKNAGVFCSGGVPEVRYMKGRFFTVLKRSYYLDEDVYTVIDIIVHLEGLRLIRRILNYRGIRCKNVREI